MASPRVLQVVLSLNPGGTERLVVELVDRLNPEIPMAVCCLDDQGTWGSLLEQRGVPVTALRRRPGFHPALAGKVARAARRHRADVLHCHHYSPFVYGCLARVLRPGAQVLFTEHGRLSDKGPSRKRRIANGVLSHVPQGVFAVSDNLKAHLTAEGFPSETVRTVYNGITLGEPASPSDRDDIRRRLSLQPGTLLLGAVARLDPVKNLESLIRATTEVVRRLPTALLVVGDGPERARLEAAAARSPVAHLIRFVGHQDDARRWLAGCDIYVNCSLTEGVSLTILEAMATGLPVVATRVGGTPEIIDDSCGRLIPSRDDAALTAALLELAAAPEVRSTLGRAARARVVRDFSIDRMVAEYRDLYRSAMHVRH